MKIIQKIKNRPAWINVEFVTIIFLILIIGLRVLFPDIQSPPFIASLLAFFAVFLFPGTIITGIFPQLARDDWFKRIPLAYAFSYAFWAIPSYFLLSIHSTWQVFGMVFLGGNLLLILAYCLWYWRVGQNTFQKGESGEKNFPDQEKKGWRKDWGTIILAVLLVAALVLVGWLSTTGSPDGDVLTLAGLIRSVAQDRPFIEEEPLFGQGFPMPARGAKNPWLLLPAFISRETGVDPVDLMIGNLPAFLSILAVLSIYSLVEAFSGKRDLAIFAALFTVIYLAAAPFHRHGNSSYMLFRRLMSDKSMLLLIMLPNAMVMLRQFIVRAQKRYVIFFGVIGVGIGLTHAVITLFLFISTVAYLGVYLIANGIDYLKTNKQRIDSSKAEWDSYRSKIIHSALAVGIVLGFMIVPYLQRESQKSSSGFLFTRDFSDFSLVENYTLLTPVTAAPSFYVPGGRTFGVGELAEQGVSDPYILRRFYTQVRAHGLVIFSEKLYMSHPDLIWDIGPILALLLTPFLFIWAKKDPLALYLIAIMAAYPMINFNPLIATLVGRLITPWLLYRFTWPLPVTIVLAYFLFHLLSLLRAKLFRSNHSFATSQSAMGLFALLVFVVLLWPNIQKYTGTLLSETDRLSSMTADFRSYMKENLEGTEDTVILSDYKSNQFVAALFDTPDVVAHRYNTTSEQFPADLQDEALARTLAIDHFSEAKFFDQTIINTIIAYDVTHVLVRSDKELACQFSYLDSNFNPLYQDENYSLYQVDDLEIDQNIAAGNTHRANQEWDLAIQNFEKALELNPNSIVSLIGLGESVARSGKPEEALNYYQIAAEIRPDDPCILPHLARGNMEIGNLEEAGSIYLQALALNPSNAAIKLRLGDVYLLSGLRAQAQTQYLEAVMLQSDNQNIDPAATAGQLSTHDDLGAEIVNPESGTYQGTVANYILSSMLFSEEDHPGDVLKETERLLDLETIKPDYLLLTNLAIAYKKTDLGIQFFQNELKDHPRDIRIHYFLGNLYEVQGKDDLALKSYLSSVRYGLLQLDWNVQARLKVGYILEKQGHLDQAIREYQKTAFFVPFDASPHLELARVFETVNDEEGILAAYADARRANPNDFRIYIKEGDYLVRSGRVALATNVYQEGLDIVNRSPVLNNKYGETLLRAGETELAKQYFLASIKSETNQAGAYIALAQFESSEGNWWSALYNSQQALIQAPNVIAPYLTLGDLYLSQGNLEIAEIAYREAARIRPNDVTSILRLANLLRLQGNDEEAAGLLKSIIPANIKSVTTLVEIGLGLLSFGAQEEAAIFFDRAMELDPGLERAQLARANLFMTQDVDWQSAISGYQAALEANPYSETTLLALANSYERIGLFNEAERIYSNLILKDPATSQAYLKLSGLQHQQGNWQAALDTLLQAPQSEQINLAVASLYQKRGDVEKAQAAYFEAIELYPHLTDAYSNAANLIMENDGVTFEDRTDRARSLLLDSLSLQPDAWKATIPLAEFEESLNNIDEAESLYWEAVDLEFLEISPLIQLGQFYLRQNRFDDALEVFNRALSRSKNNNSIYVGIGDALLALGQSDEALQMYEVALEIDRSDPLGYMELADYYQGQNRLDAALDVLEGSILVNPAEASLYLELGNLYLEMKHTAAAEEMLLRSSQLDQRNSKYSLALGNFYLATDQPDLAVSAYQDAIEIEPGNANGYAGLGRTYQQMGNYLLAEQSFSQGVLNSNDIEIALVSRADYYSDQAQWALAEADLIAARDIAPNSQTAALQLAQFYLRRGAYSSSDELLQEISAKFGLTASIEANFGDLYSAQAQWNKAISSYQSAIDKEPALTDAYLGLINVYRISAPDDKRLDDLFQSALEANPRNANLYQALGELYVSRMDYPAAREAFSQALSYNSTNTEVWLSLNKLNWLIDGEYYPLHLLHPSAQELPAANQYLILARLGLNSGDLPKALDGLKLAVEADPSNGEIWASFGDYYLELDHPDLALEAYQKASEFSPLSEEIWQSISKVNSLLGNDEEAEKALLHLLSFNPRSTIGIINLSNLRAEQGDLPGAMILLEDGIQTIPGETALYGALAQLHIQDGNLAQAEQVIQDGLMIIPGNANLHSKLGDIYLDQYRILLQSFLNAEELLERVELAQYGVGTGRNSESRERDLLFRYYLATKSFRESDSALTTGEDYLDQADDSYQQALITQPSMVNAMIALSWIALLEDDQASAAEYLLQATESIPYTAQENNKLGELNLAMGNPEEAEKYFLISLELIPGNADGARGLRSVDPDQVLGSVTNATQNLALSQVEWEILISQIRRGIIYP